MKSLNERAIREEMDVPVAIPTADGSGIAETITVRVTIMRDPQTGDFFLDDEAMDAIDKAKSRHLGLLSPEDIRGLRVQLHLTQEEMSRLLKIGEKTYTRWETGRSRPSQAMNLLLLGLRDGVISTGWLQTVLKKQFRWNPTPPDVRWSSFWGHGLQGLGVSPPSPTACAVVPDVLRNQLLFEHKKPLIRRKTANEEFATTA
ncbi:MAG: helix-turn-helix domain-containing protein [Verrucomicrobiia bacterium]|jgi:DNA-binding transcriptional regulator YiaG